MKKKYSLPGKKKRLKQFQNTHKIYLSSGGMSLLPRTTGERADFRQGRNRAAFLFCVGCTLMT